MAARRARRSAEEARRRILEAAEKRLVEGGPDAVRVQPLARDLGITDAAIHYHFGSREELLAELLKYGGRQLREAVRSAVNESVEAELDLPAFVEAASAVFRDRGYARLALWLRTSGWRERGTGMFDGLVEGIRAAAPRRGDRETRHVAALVALVLMAEPIFGDAARRSVSLPAGADERRQFDAFLLRAFESLVGADPPG